jgi:hypothetical protein
MSTKARAGIRAAKGLLSLLEENSAEEFEAAAAILSGQKELMTILQLLRKYKGGEQEEEEPLSIEKLRGIVRRELLELHASARVMSEIAEVTLQFTPRTTPGTKVEDVVDRILQHIKRQIPSPSAQVEALTGLLVTCAQLAGPEQQEKIELVLRDLAAKALAENIVVFPTSHALAQLQARWVADGHHLFPLPRESRQHFASRLLDDAQKQHPERFLHIWRDLLCEGMRSPADSAITAIRGMKRKKANGEE